MKLSHSKLSKSIFSELSKLFGITKPFGLSLFSRKIFSLWGIILTGLIVFSSLNADSQKLYTHNYSVIDGLPSSSVFDITQDSTGMLWCATSKGICSFDGNKWVNYNNITGHVGYGHHFVKCDEKGDLWTIYNDNRLIVSCYHHKQWITKINIPSPAPNVPVDGFEVFHQKGEVVIIAATAREGLLVCTGNTLRQYIHGTELPGTQIFRITKYRDKVWVATDKGICSLQNGVIDRLPELNRQLPSLPVVAVNFPPVISPGTASPALWVFGINWLGYFLDGKFNLVSDDFYLISDSPSPIGIVLPLNDGEVFFGTAKQLYHIAAKGAPVVKIGRNEGLTSDGVYCMLPDYEKNIWIGAVRGLTCIPFVRFTTFSSAEGLPEEEVSSGLELSPGKFLFGFDAAVAFYDGSRFSSLKLSDARNKTPHESRVQDMCLDRHKNIWIALSNEGIARVNPDKKVTWFNKQFPGNDRFVSVAEAPDGKIFVGARSGLYYIENDKVTRSKFIHPGVFAIRKIFFDSENTMYIGTVEEGLLTIRNGHLHQFYIRERKQANNVFAFLEDSKHHRWVGTIDGLYELKDSALQKVELPGIPENRAIYLILEDRNGVFWFGTDDGVFRWNGIAMQHYTVRDGISGPDINRDAGFIDSNNDIWFGTNQGITKIPGNFDKLISRIPPPQIFLDSLVTQHGKYSFGENLSLSNDENNLEFQFKSITFLDPDVLKINFKLEPFDKKWSEDVSSSTRSVRYRNLPPGKYRFYIKVRNTFDVVSKTIVSPEIQIEYPWYLRWWVVLLAFGILSYLGYFIFRYIIYRRYNQHLEITVKQRTQELKESETKLMQSNRSKDRFISIIGHDLRSPLSAILGYLDLMTDQSFELAEDERVTILEKMKNATFRTLSLLDNILSWARTQQGDLHVDRVWFDISEVISENLILSESTATAKNIRLRYPNEKPVFVSGDKNMIQTVVRNLLSNAIKFSYPGGVIDIGIINGAFEIIVSVKDYGCGIPPESQAKIFSIDEHIATRGTNKEAGTGLGLILCMEFIRLNKGKLWLESEPDKGSTFYFSLPVE